MSAPERTGADPFAAHAPEDAALGAEAERVAGDVARRAEVLLGDLDVDVLVSANVFLDVLPRGVNKGSTLRRVLDWLAVDEAACVVAGDSLNDLALFEAGLRGIAVGNCEPALRRRVARLPHIYQASAHGVDGVLEGLRYHGILDEDRKRGHDHGG
jgi:hydroxymethylpyrimidine pyrophosphatase-like HAD family hydrolase